MNAAIQKDFEEIMIQKNASTGHSSELYLSSFGYQPLRLDYEKLFCREK